MRHVELDERLRRYEVTAVPAGPPAALRLVWSAPAATSPTTVADDVADDDASGAEILPLLAAYRITLVPLHQAS